MEINLNLPVLVIAYSRPESLSKLLETLCLNGIKKIYIAIDGPKNQRDLKNQQHIDFIISNFIETSGLQVNVLKQRQNLGIAVAIIGAIDWFFEKEPAGIILEDDLIVSDYFFEFTNKAIESYERNNDVWMISGTQLHPNFGNSIDVIWTNYPMIWGWASWSNKWFQMRHSILSKKESSFSQKISATHQFWLIGANRVLSGIVDTWDTPLAYEFMIQNKFCILPPVNYICNVGDDAVSTNTKSGTIGVGIKIDTVNNSYNFTNYPDIRMVKKYNKFLELKVFRIKYKHIFLPIYALLFDYFRFPKVNRKQTLPDRINQFKL